MNIGKLLFQYVREMEGIKSPHTLKFNAPVEDEPNPRPVKLWRDNSGYYMTLGGAPEVEYQIHIARDDLSNVEHSWQWYSEKPELIGNIHDPNIIEKVETVVRTFLNADGIDSFKRDLRKLTHKKKHKKVST